MTARHRPPAPGAGSSRRKTLACCALVAGFLASLVAGSASLADERLLGIACRSVHLGYSAPDGIAFYNEVTVETSARGTYFAVCGWDKGYYGIQELANGKKLLIFSVWDSHADDSNAVPEADRVRMPFKDPDVRVGRFGGEGSGGQSFFDYDWKPGATYRFLIAARPAEKRTEYTAWFFVPEAKRWKRLVTFSTITGGKLLRGYYSFVEDFRRDKTSATEARKARYGNGWVRGEDGRWTSLRSARFTADANPDVHIDAGAANDSAFFLATGGATQNIGVQLKETIRLPEPKDSAAADAKKAPPEARKPPDDLPAELAPGHGTTR